MIFVASGYINCHLLINDMELTVSAFNVTKMSWLEAMVIALHLIAGSEIQDGCL